MHLKLKDLNPFWVILIVLLLVVIVYDGYMMLKLNRDLDRLDDMVSHIRLDDMVFHTTSPPSVPPNRD